MSESATPAPVGGAIGPTRLEDVARLAGVSKSTASKALNNRDHVNAETRRRVLAAAERLAFQPSAVARHLTAGRTSTVGVLTNDLEGRFVLPIIAGAEDALGAGRLSVILCDARGDAIRERQHLATLLERRIDGLLIIGGNRTDPRPPIGRNLPVPVVYVYAPSTDPGDVSVIVDNHQSGRVAAEHLWSVGRRRIAFVGGDPTFVASRERAEGAQAALADVGSELVAAEVNGDWTERWGRIAASRILDAHNDVDAIIGASDGLARAALDILRDHGRRIPDDVAVIGFDNWELIATNTRPPLTSVDPRLGELGRTAAHKLFAALAGEPPAPGIERRPVHLRVRESTVLDP